MLRQTQTFNNPSIQKLGPPKKHSSLELHCGAPVPAAVVVVLAASVVVDPSMTAVVVVGSSAATVVDVGSSTIAVVVVGSSMITTVVVGISVVPASVALSTIVDEVSVVLSMTVAVEVTSVMVPGAVVVGRQGLAFAAAIKSASARTTLEDSIVSDWYKRVTVKSTKRMSEREVKKLKIIMAGDQSIYTTTE